MKCIYVDLIGYPKVTSDDEIVKFPFKKAEGIFYMLLLEGQLERVKLCSYFWPEANEEIGKKNLRNAIYSIRKVFGVDIFMSSSRALIQIDRSIVKVNDYDRVISEDVEFLTTLLENDRIELLDDFYIPDLIEFDEWLSYKKNHFMEKLNGFFAAMLNNDEITSSIKINICKKLIQLDEFDEKSYIRLIELYKEEREYQKSVEVFNKLENILKSELSITPSLEAVNLIDGILNERQKKDEKRESNIVSIGRDKEFNELMKSLGIFRKGENNNTVLVKGEAGIGKTNLVNNFINHISNGEYVLKIQCYPLEQDYYYESFRSVMEQISSIIREEDIHVPTYTMSALSALYPSFGIDYDIQMYMEEERNFGIIEKAVLNIFSIFGNRKNIILIIEDVHWMDKMSLQILKTILCQNTIKVFTIMTSRNAMSSNASNLIYHMKSRSVINEIVLERLNEELTRGLISHYVEIERNWQDYIYRESEGNPLFIMEYVNNIKQNKGFDILKSKAGDVIKSRIINLPLEVRKILEICSVFLDYIQLDALEKITGKGKIDLIDIIDDLLERNILVEKQKDRSNLELHFTHNKIKTFVKSEMSRSKKILLNKRFAEYYENRLGGKHDRELYLRLSFHYGECNMKIKQLEYRLKRFSGLVKINHEMFPEIDDYEMNKGTAVYLSETDIDSELKSIEKEYQSIKKSEFIENYKDVEIVYLYTMGRLLVDTGKHQSGRELIEKMIELAEKSGNLEYCIRGWFKIIHQTINSFDLDGMNFALENLEKLVTEEVDEGITAKVKRLKGYYCVLAGRYKDGEVYLNDAMETFKKLEFREKYILNIAASYMYIGESKRLQEKFEESISYYDKALAICSDKKLLSGIAYILASKGRVYYELGKIDKAEEFLLESIKYYSKIVFVWGRVIPSGYLALVYAGKRDEKNTYKYFKLSMEYIANSKNNYEKGMICRIKTELIKSCRDFSNWKKLEELIMSDLFNCCFGDLKCFDNPAMTYEKRRINELLDDKDVKYITESKK
ncbi:Predicted ATPase [Dethiosulfatibacter aminovorans DSM 17477]|uniref:Predicted ATPase n=1 Tax=Dethiosulfatibacter aminovorans DSM 17477 TaxID=1121476 RepID=A0A1M6G1Q3_9FIRM|nr:AAA family ATPase [Dethiosulfatibacter aminovorans]SHJ03839.1 Predicted ATPase [Dethiosulfatibacter aminovorans DSM 17477]